MAATHRGKVLILGSGPAGYTAAIYAARASLKPMLVQGIQPGGQLTITTDVENYPGFADVIQGPWLMEQMQKQAEHVGTQLFFDTVVEVDLSRAGRSSALGDSGDRYEADALIISTGATAKWLGIPTEETFRGGGVSACATCDGFFFRGKEVVVVGGGNTAVEEALYLTHHASKVTLIHRRDAFRAEKILQDRLFKNPKVTVLWDTRCRRSWARAQAGAAGQGRAGAQRQDRARRRSCATDGVFIAIGHSPNTELFKGKLAMDSEGYLITKPDSTATDIEGVYAAGDVQDKIFRQAVTAAGTGCMAALEAEKWLARQEARLAQAAE